MYSPATGVSSLLHNSELKLADSHGRNIYFLCVELATDEEAILAVAIRCAYSLLYVEPSYEAKKFHREPISSIDGSNRAHSQICSGNVKHQVYGNMKMPSKTVKIHVNVVQWTTKVPA